MKLNRLAVLSPLLSILLGATGFAPISAFASAYSVSSGFAATANPNGPWSYGWIGGLGGTFTALQVPHNSADSYGLVIPSWQLTSFQTPAVYCNTSTSTASVSGGLVQFPPGACWFFPGEDGRPENFGVIRFAVPAGGAGTYEIKAAVAPIYNGSPQGDTDFHVVKNGVELFGVFLATTESAGYTNAMSLAEGDTIDLVIGRGTDGSAYGSGLRIDASLTTDVNVPTPPSIVTQPQSQVVGQGADVTFAVAAEGEAPLNYQWRHNGVDIAQATNANLILENVQSADAGAYTVQISNSEGIANSIAATLTVVIPPPPGSFDANRDFSLASNPNGAWSYGSIPAIGGPFSLITFPLTQPAANGVLVQSWQLNRHSEPAVFCNTSSETATTGPEGTFPPRTIWFFGGYPDTGQDLGAIRFTLPPGEDGAYRIEVAVQHYLDGPPAGDTEFHVAKNGAELFGQYLAPADRAGYTNSLTLAAGDTVDFLTGRGADNQLYGSGLKIAARITRTDLTNFPPLILVQPRSQTVPAGSSVTFSVVAEGTAPISYQWFFNGVELSDATNSILALPDVAAAVAGRYSVRVANTFGTVASIEAKLNVITPPPPGSYDLSRDFSASDNPAGAWSFGWTESIGGTFSLLTVPHVSLAPAMITPYQIPTTGVIIPSWQLTSYQTPAVYQNSSTNVVSIAGGQGVFPPGTVWYYPGEDGRAENFGVIRFKVPTGAAGVYHLETTVRSVYEGTLSRDTDFHVVKNGAEIFSQVLPANSVTGFTNALALSVGDTIDFLIGRGADGSQYASGLKIQVTLNLDETVTDIPPLIVSQPQGQSTPVGSSATFSISAEGTAPLTYQWRFNGADLPGETSPTLTVNSVTLASSGAYSVRVSNPVGSTVSSDALLTVVPIDIPPSIVTQPAGRVVPPGETVVLSITAAGTEPMSYQWRFNGTDIPNATSNRLVLVGVQSADAGAYSAVVSNPYGTVESAGAQLVVTSILQGGSVNFANRSGSLDAPIFDIDGVTRVSGPNFRAQLYAGATVGSLAAVGNSVGFTTNGYFSGGTRIIPDVAPGQLAYLQVRVWDRLSGTNYDLALSAGGKAGASSIFSLTTGGSGMPPTLPPNLEGLTSFSLVQAAFSLAMARIGGPPAIRLVSVFPDGTILWRLSGDTWATYTIEYSSDLQEWQTLQTVFTDNGAVEFSDPTASTARLRFYRARLGD